MVFVEEGDHVEHTEEPGTAMPDLPQRHLSSVSAENDQAGPSLRLSVWWVPTTRGHWLICYKEPRKKWTWKLQQKGGVFHKKGCFLRFSALTVLVYRQELWAFKPQFFGDFPGVELNTFGQSRTWYYQKHNFYGSLRIAKKSSHIKYLKNSCEGEVWSTLPRLSKLDKISVVWP